MSEQATQQKKKILATAMPARRFVLEPLSRLEKGLILVSSEDKHEELVYELDEEKIRTLRRLPDSTQNWKRMELSEYVQTIVDNKQGDSMKVYKLELIHAITLERCPDFEVCQPYDTFAQGLSEAGM